jgi:hypothetical protein
VNDEPPLISLEFAVSDVKNVLLKLDSSKETRLRQRFTTHFKESCFRVSFGALSAHK